MGIPGRPTVGKRRWVPIATAVVLLALLGGAPVRAEALGGPWLPKNGALFGAFVAVDPHTGSTRIQAMANFEALVGRSMAVDRVYYGWDTMFLTDPADYADRDAGRTIVVSWGITRKDGVFLDWRDIAKGKEDAEIDRHAQLLESFGAPVFLIFNHEPERYRDGLGGVDAGTSAEFVAAYQHIHDRLVADGVSNVSYVLTLMACTYSGTCSGHPEPPDHYYPGDAYVDLLAADGYNFYGCRGDTWKDFEGIFGEFYAYGLEKKKPMMLSEWGSTEDPLDRARKADWLSQAGAALKDMPQVKVVAYFDGGQVCDTLWADSTPQALAAFRAMGADPYFNPS